MRPPRPWPAIDVAELRYALAFGSSVEEIADFLQRDVDDVRHCAGVLSAAYRFIAGPPIGMIGLRQSFARAEFLPQRCFLLRPISHPRGRKGLLKGTR
jgi:hypothetical protein